MNTADRISKIMSIRKATRIRRGKALILARERFGRSAQVRMVGDEFQIGLEAEPSAFVPGPQCHGNRSKYSKLVRWPVPSRYCSAATMGFNVLGTGSNWVSALHSAGVSLVGVN